MNPSSFKNRNTLRTSPVILIFALAEISHLTAKTARAEKAALQPTLATIAENFKKSHDNKGAKQVQKIAAALDTGKYDVASSLAKRLQGDPLWRDYSYYLQIVSLRKHATQLLEKKSPTVALDLAKQIKPLVFKINSEDPYSYFNKKLQDEMAFSELIEGDSFAISKKWKQARSTYEAAFQRLSYLSPTSGAWSYLKLNSLENYVNACQPIKNNTLPNEECINWIQRLSNYYPKNSQEGKVFSEPTVEELYLKNKLTSYAGKGNQAFKSPDLDTAAFDEAIALYREGRYGSSADAFKKFNEEYARSSHRYRSKFWLAQSLRMDKGGKITEESK